MTSPASGGYSTTPSGTFGRATGGAAGFPAQAQGTRTSFAQSGGKATTFAGGTGGNAWQSAGGGARGTQVKGTGTLFNGTPYNLRSPGGDATMIPGAFKGAGSLNLSTSGNTGPTNTSIVTPHALAPPGFGGGF